jgi:hypothetical protein
MAELNHARREALSKGDVKASLRLASQQVAEQSLAAAGSTDPDALGAEDREMLAGASLVKTAIEKREARQAALKGTEKKNPPSVKKLVG